GQVVDHGGRRNQRVPFRPGIRNVRPARVPRDGYVDRQHAARENVEDVVLEPGSQPGGLGPVAPFDPTDPQFHLQNRHRGQVEIGRRPRCNPGTHRTVGPVGGFTKLAQDIRVEQVAHNSGTFGCNWTGSKSTSMSSVMLSRSTRSAPVSPSRRYSSIDSSTNAGSPRSVISTGPSSAARLAALTSRLNSRALIVVIVTTRDVGT